MNSTSSIADPSEEMQFVTLGMIPDIQVTSGIVAPVPSAAGGVPIIQIEQVQNGTLTPDVRVHVAPEVHYQNPRSALRIDDLVLVMIGDVGRTARVTPQFVDWNASSGIGIIRCVDQASSSRDLIDWLEFWFATPTMQSWFSDQAKRPNHRAYLTVSTLRERLAVPLPPEATRRKSVETLRAMQEQASDCVELAEQSVNLADRIFARTKATAPSKPLALKSVAVARTGERQRGKTTPQEIHPHTISAADVLNSRTPCMQMLGQTSACRSHWQQPNKLIIATRPGEAKIVLDLVGDTAGARGTVTLRATDARDHWWLMHELRARSLDSSHPSFPGNGRELSARALGTIAIDWPTDEVRHTFAAIAISLHERAALAMEHSADLRKMIGLLPEKIVRDTATESSAVTGPR